MYEVGFVEIIILAFILFVLYIVLKDLFGSKSLDWDEVIDHAVKNYATSILIGEGKPVQIKVGNNWDYINLPEATETDIDNLKAMLESQAQNSVWKRSESTTIKILRNENSLVELELNAD